MCPKPSRTRLSLASCLPLLLAAVPACRGDAPTAPAAAAEPPAALVATIALEPGPIELTLSPKVGLLRAWEHRVLSFEVAGRLVEVVEPGSAVSEGGTVGRLDPLLEEAQLRQAALRVEEARREVERVRNLHESSAASGKAVDDAETALALRRAEQDVARERLDRRAITAPYAGVVGEKYFEQGEVVAAGAPAFTLLDLSALRLELGVPGSQIARVLPGASARISVPGVTAQDETLPATVERVALAPDDGRHLYEVELRVPNPGSRLRPGMPARAAIVTETRPDAVRVPLARVVERGGEAVAFFADGEQARAVSVADAPLQGDSLVVGIDGATPSLIIRGERDLRDGQAIRVDNTVLAGAERLP